MTDPITCPECGGRGEAAIGRLRLRCQFCGGRGEVGGDHEPAEGGHKRTDGFRQPEEGEEYDPDVHGPLPAAGEHPVVQESGVCGQCFGTGRVINLGDLLRGEVHGKLIEQPCPACSAG